MIGLLDSAPSFRAASARRYRSAYILRDQSIIRNVSRDWYSSRSISALMVPSRSERCVIFLTMACPCNAAGTAMRYIFFKGASYRAGSERPFPGESSASWPRASFPGKFFGIVEFTAGIVREFESADRRASCVMDSAEKENPLHADIITDGKWSKMAPSKLRNELRQLLLDPKPAMP